MGAAEPAGGALSRGATTARLRTAFVGDSGVRAGWRVLAFLVLAGAIQIPIVLTLSALGIHQSDLAEGRETARGVALSVALGLCGILVATIAAAFVERRSVADYGLARGRAATRFVQGAGVGVLLMSGLAALLIASGALAYQGVVLRGADAARSALQWAAAALLVSLYEELAIRGYLLHALSRGVGFRAAAVLTSLLFAAGHLANPGEGVVGVASVVLIGLVLSYSVLRFGSLWWAIGFHAAWNWTQSFVFGVSNSGSAAEGHLLATGPTGPTWLSGGATGPEGSVLNLVAIAAAALAVQLARPSRGTSVTRRGGPP